ncbi:conserved hypothetical protein, membrane [Candidatus Magnetomorum sp. HK-1]|nr:conserved hypothetical protein, membrane [Candidatus Magnetomorum sp. HK-1]
MKEKKSNILSTIDTKTKVLALISLIAEALFLGSLPTLPSNHTVYALITCATILIISIIGIIMVELAEIKSSDKMKADNAQSFNLKKELSEIVSLELSKHCKYNKKDNLNCVIDFYETYRHINWKKYIDNTNYTIDIVVYYFDSWINTNYENLIDFFSKPNAKIRIFVSDPHNEHNINYIQRLFPDSSKDELIKKIETTGQKLYEVIKKATNKTNSKAEFYYFPNILSYSLQVFDNKTMIYSIFEMYRDFKIDSPAIIIDLEKSSHLTEFVKKEIENIKKDSKLIKNGA